MMALEAEEHRQMVKKLREVHATRNVRKQGSSQMGLLISEIDAVGYPNGIILWKANVSG